MISKRTRVRGMLYLIFNKHSPVPLKSKIQIYQSYIRPIVTYARQFWSSSLSKSNWLTLKRIQNIILRITLSSPQFVSNLTICNLVHVNTLQETIMKQTKNVFAKNWISTFPHIREFGHPSPLKPQIKNSAQLPGCNINTLKFL